MPSDPLVGGESRVILYPTSGSLTGAIDVSILSITKLTPTLGMKPVNTIKDYVSADKLTYGAERSTTKTLEFGFDGFTEGEISQTAEDALFGGKPTGGIAIYQTQAGSPVKVFYCAKFTGTIQHKPGTTEDFQQYSVEGKSYGPYLTGSAAQAAIAALT